MENENDSLDGDDTDIFICGRCKQQFHAYDLFKNHKKSCTEAHNVLQENISEKPGPSHTHRFLTDEQTKCLEEVLGYEAVDAADVLATQFFSLSSNKQPIFEVIVATTSEENPPQCDDFFEQGSLKIVEKPFDEDSQNSHKLVLTSSPAKLKANFRKAAPGYKTYACDMEGCKSEFRYHKDLVRHNRIHTGEKPFACGFCKKAYSRADKLQLHTMRHKNIKPYACGVCDYTCISSSNLKIHQMIHSDKRPFKCQICPYRARGSSQLAVHLRRHTGDLPFRCTYSDCKAQFKTGSNLRRHQKTHSSDKPFACDLCFHQCNLKGNLRSHMKKVHLKADLRFKCKRCKLIVFQANSFESLLKHNLDSHKEGLIKCDSSGCDSFFYKKSGLEDHIKKKHKTDNKPSFCCSMCKFVCTKESTLMKHETAKHANLSCSTDAEKANHLDRQFKCDECEASFVREDSLRAHAKMHKKTDVAQSNDSILSAQMHIQDFICIIPSEPA